MRWIEILRVLRPAGHEPLAGFGKVLAREHHPCPKEIERGALDLALLGEFGQFGVDLRPILLRLRLFRISAIRLLSSSSWTPVGRRNINATRCTPAFAGSIDGLRFKTAW